MLPDAHENIAVTCITYLLMRPSSEEGALTDHQAFALRTSSCPLLGYAAVFWGHHVTQADCERARSLSLRLLNTETSRQSAAQALLLNTTGATAFAPGPEWPDCSQLSPWYENRQYKSSLVRVPALHLASYFGIEQICRELLDCGMQVNKVDGGGGTALHWALLGQQNSMVVFLLDAGADPNIKGNNLELRRWSGMCEMFPGPLNVAAMTDNITAIEVLLQHGADINRDEREKHTSLGGSSALGAALHHMSVAAAHFLLDRGADPNLSGQAMLWTLLNCSVDLIEKLIEKGLSAKNKDWALQLSARSGHTANIEMLIKVGANVEPEVGHIDNIELADGEDILIGCAILILLIRGNWSNESSSHLNCVSLVAKAIVDLNRICASPVMLRQRTRKKGKPGMIVPTNTLLQLFTLQPTGAVSVLFEFLQSKELTSILCPPSLSYPIH